MEIAVSPLSPTRPEVARMVASARALADQLFPAEDNHGLEVEALAASGVHLLGAFRGDEVLGMIALAECDGYGEIKSLWVEPAARGSGTGRILVAAVEPLAHTLGLAVLRLETGAALAAACRLYRANGYRDRDAFGDYSDGTTSIFMEKRL